MNQFLQIVQQKNGFQELVQPLTLDQLHSLRTDGTFYTTSFSSPNPDIMKLHKLFSDVLPFVEQTKETGNRIPWQVSKAWFHRTMCAVKAMELWKKYRREYVIDRDWYNDFMSTEDIRINFSLQQKLPFDSFYVDMSNLDLLHTNHYENVIGVIVNIMNERTLHLTVVDANNVQYNPVQYYGNSDELIVKMKEYNNLSPCNTFFMGKEELKNYVSGTNVTFGEFIKEHGSYERVRDLFPKSWQKYDTGEVRFVDFLIGQDSNGNVLAAKKNNANECLGWRLCHGGVVEGIDLQSPVINQVIKFIIPFLYFLHSKTNDVICRGLLNQDATQEINQEFTQAPTQDITQVAYNNIENKETEKEADRAKLQIETWDVGTRYGERIRTLQRKRKLYGDRVVGGDAADAVMENVAANAGIDTRNGLNKDLDKGLGEKYKVKTKNIRPNRPRAYVRCAHWHRYWCGNEENRHVELRWLEPTYCNGAISDIVTVINEVSDEDIRQSNGEHAISSYLDKVGISYAPESVVNIKGHNRRFDFDVCFNNKRLFIEFDGEQHFRPVEVFGGMEAFRERKRADFDKNKYAKKHKIPLLRIRYDQMEQIPDLIDSFLEHPSLSRLNPVMDNTKYYNNF